MGAWNGDRGYGMRRSARVILLDGINQEGGVWTRQRAYAYLKSKGWRSDSPQVLRTIGVVLSRMAIAGEIRRGRRGEFGRLGDSPLDKFGDGQYTVIPPLGTQWEIVIVVREREKT